MALALKYLINPFQDFHRLFQPELHEDNFTSVVYRLLREYRIKVTITSIVEYIKSHPDYTSLKSICDFFSEVNILNYPLRIDESDLYKIDDPFIAYTKESGGKVLVIYSINKEHVVYADSLKGNKILSTQKFLENWAGVIIAIEPTEISGENDYSEKRNSEILNSMLLPSAIFLYCLALIYGIFKNKSFSSGLSELSFYLLIITHIIGLAFSFLLLQNELNLKTKFSDKLCHIATKVDCDAVTKSKASKIFGNITWADFGVTYFSGGLLTFFILPFTYSLCNLTIFAIIAIPYPIFSILYQWLKIKKWCPLCLSVQLVIIVESIIAFNILRFDKLNITSSILVLIIFLMVFLVVLLFKFLFISDREKDYIKLEALRLKRDPQVFLYKLLKGEKIDIHSDKSALIFGNNLSEVLLSVFLSFHCSACAKKFDSIVKLINSNSKFKIQLIFAPPKDGLSDQLLKKIFELVKSGQNKRALEELRVWYNTDAKARLKLMKDIKIKDNHKIHNNFKELINYNSSLFRIGKIVAVPVVYVNGYKLPDTISLEDIKYHISELEKMKYKLIEVEV